MIRNIRNIIGTCISDWVLQILSWLAEKEKERIKSRHREDIDIVLKNGVHFSKLQMEITDPFTLVYTE